MPLLQGHFKAVAGLRDRILSHVAPGRKVDEYLAREDVDDLNDLLEREELSPAYIAMQERVLDAMLDTFDAIPELGNLVRNWSRISAREQEDFLMYVVRLQANLQEMEAGIDVRPAELTWHNYSGTQSGGAHTSLKDKYGEDDLIKINPRPGARNLLDALNTITHEQTHVFQAFLARAVHYGHIGPDHPLYEDGVIFERKMTADSYVPPAISSSYRLQVEERDAFNFGNAVERFLEPLRPAPNPSVAWGIAAAAIGIGISLTMNRRPA